MAYYPTAIPNSTNYIDRTDDVHWIYAARYNEIKNEVLALCKELGISPSGGSATVVARLALLALKANVLELDNTTPFTPSGDYHPVTKKYFDDNAAPLDSPVFTTKITAPIIDLTGGQIAFPATAAPSAGVNTLDDYEEGTFVPDLQFGSAKVGITYTYRVGKYTKIGNKVFFECTFYLSSKGTSTGVVEIYGLPFTVGGGANYHSALALSFFYITFADILTARVAVNQTRIDLIEITKAGGQTNLTNADFSNDSFLVTSGHYEV